MGNTRGRTGDVFLKEELNISGGDTVSDVSPTARPVKQPDNNEKPDLISEDNQYADDETNILLPEGYMERELNRS